MNSKIGATTWDYLNSWLGSNDYTTLVDVGVNDYTILMWDYGFILSLSIPF